ncbi:serine hydrolase [Lysinibacillus sp. KU-BSD001]|uniref:serine hydrolase n=1 Tax=Lysinibacillus sp. KU-BSD001 TaxID=3141328 RepID=UPI0036E62972
MIRWLLITIIALGSIAIGVGIWLFQKDSPAYLIQFIKDKAANQNVALSIHYNGDSWIEVNEQVPLPLASTVKTIVAIEYAKQAADGRINPEQKVRLEELDHFYLPKTDGGAHAAWLADINAKDDVPLSEVANGMIAYSSNANTEYLMQVLGLTNINAVPKSLKLSHHEPLYPIVSASYIPVQLMHEKGLTKKEVVNELKNMDMDEYRNRAIAIHKKWLHEPLDKQEREKLLKVMDMDVQKIWSDRLPRATTSDYVTIMQNLNSKAYFSETIHHYLDPVMEQLMQNPANREWLMHAGQKGGSTAFVLTNAMYATDQGGNQTEFAFFSNDLTLIEQARLSRNLNSFQLKFLTDEAFQTQVKEELSHLRKGE